MNFLFNESNKTIALDVPGASTEIVVRASINNRVTTVTINDELIGVLYMPVMKVVRILRKGISGYALTLPKAKLSYE